MKRCSIAQGARFWVLGDRFWVLGDRCWVMYVRVIKFFIFHLSFFISLASCSPTPPPPTTSSSSSLTILFTGDVLLDRGVRHTAEHRGIGYIFEKVTPIFREADAVVVNLECPLTDTISPVNKKYRSSPRRCRYHAIRLWSQLQRTDVARFGRERRYQRGSV